MHFLQGFSPSTTDHNDERRRRSMKVKMMRSTVSPFRLARALTLWVIACVLAVGHNLLLLSKVDLDAGPSPPKSRAEAPLTPTAGALTIGVAVTVTSCSGFFPLDGAVVLRHSILRHMSDRYRYRFYAIHHPGAASCVPQLADAGYELLERDTPVNVSEIKGDFLRETISKRGGCCGEKELVKFEAFLLTQHPAVILMDLDMLVLKPLDDIVDLILSNEPRPELASRHVEEASAHGASAAAAAAAASAGDVWILYVNEYPKHFKAVPPYYVQPSQGGFAVLKPNRTIYSEIQDIVREGNFDPTLGWGNATQTFWGASTFQGLLPYYFQVLHPGYALALDPCVHDHMALPPRGDGTAPPLRCQRTAWEDIVSVHLTDTAKPWLCRAYPAPDAAGQAQAPQSDSAVGPLAQGTWFRYRSELEMSWGRSGRGQSNGSHLEAALGYCSEKGLGGYERIRRPYGRAPVGGPART